MVELDFARQILAMAQAFLQLGMRTQVIYRVILSRLYYAAHHVGRLMLRNQGLTPEQWPHDVHQRVLDELRRGFVDTGVMSNQALHALRRLRRYRVQADYELQVRIRDRHVAEAIALFTTYFDKCRQILGVP